MRLKLILITYIFIFAFLGGFAQPELKIIGRITSADGLLSNGIKYTYKDSQGFMWFTYRKVFSAGMDYRLKTIHTLLILR